MKMSEEFFENEENVGWGVMRGHLSIGIKDGYYAVPWPHPAHSRYAVLYVQEVLTHLIK